MLSLPKTLISVNKIYNHKRILPWAWLYVNRHIVSSTTDSSTEENLIVEKKQEDVSHPFKKKPQKPPFVKNLFLGKFDREILTYPQMEEKDRYEMLNEMVQPIEKFFREEVDSAKIDREAVIPQEVLNGLKELGLYGLQIPVEYGGLGLSATEYARIGEIISLDGAIAVTLSAHQAIGLKLATGEWTAAFCLTEAGAGSDAASIQTTATPTEDGKGYILNGTKIWISNGGTADVMTVFARVWDRSHFRSEVTAFIVERSFGGVTSGKPEDKMGIRGSNTTEVSFENTFVPAENVLGKEEDGFKIAMNILNSGRFSMGSASAGVLKNLMKSTVEHCVTRKQFQRTLSDFALIKEKIAKMAVDIYAMESMAYLTAGMMDIYEEQDCSVEAAIVKVFSSDRAWQHVSECLQVFGGSGYMKDYPYERILRDIRIMQIFEGTNEILRLFISLAGLQHAGQELYDKVKKLRNPFMNPSFATKAVLERFRRNPKKPKLDLDLYEFLHPSFRPAADDLEVCTKQLQFATEDVLHRDGKEIVMPEKQYSLKRLADAVIDIYAVTAVLGRASRSYCIGIHNSDHERKLAVLFAHDACERIKENVTRASLAPNNMDLYTNSVADNIFEKRGYAAEHPLTKHFW